MKVSVTQSINCSHQLPGTDMHGHTYRVTAICFGKVMSNGMVVPLQVLSAQLQHVLERVDHKQLEAVIGEPATAENLALWIKGAMPLPTTQIRVQVGDEGYVETE